MPVLPTWRRPTRLIQPQDPYFSNVALLLHMNGSNNSTTFTDSSANGLAVTANGNARISTAQSKWGGSSGFFDGANSYLSASGSLFNLPGAFTIEAWVYFASIGSSSQVICSKWASLGNYAWIFQCKSSKLQFATANDGTNPILYEASTLFSASTWYHVAAVCTGTALSLYVNGSSVGSFTDSNNRTCSTTSFCVGLNQDPGFPQWLNGYMQDLRITKSVARTIEVPIAPFPDA